MDGLSSLTTVGGDLQVVGTVQQLWCGHDVHGLQSSNSALTNVDGLSSLTTVGGDLTLVGQWSSLVSSFVAALILSRTGFESSSRKCDRPFELKHSWRLMDSNQQRSLEPHGGAL